MKYLLRLTNSDLGQAFLKSCLVMSISWFIMLGVYVFVSMLFWSFEVVLCLFFASVMWGTHVNYTWGWKVEQDDTSLKFIFKPEDGEEE